MTENPNTPQPEGVQPSVVLDDDSLLDELGYGREGSGLVLNLVYNPQGPSLPPC